MSEVSDKELKSYGYSIEQCIRDKENNGDHVVLFCESVDAAKKIASEKEVMVINTPLVGSVVAFKKEKPTLLFPFFKGAKITRAIASLRCKKIAH